MDRQPESGLTGKRVLVTGGCGFIGINLVLRLVDLGAEVTVLDLPDADWGRLPESVTQVRTDILDAQAHRGRFEGIAIVYHLAARTDLDGHDLADYRQNFDGVRTLLHALDTASLERFVFYSSILVTGIFSATRFVDESEPYRTNTLYGESKVLGERVTIEECGDAGIPWTIVRPASVYGPWGEAPYDAFFHMVKRRRYFHVGRADNLVSWVFVGNVVDHTITLSQHKCAENDIFFASDLHPYTMREITDTVAAYYGITVPRVPVLLVTAAAYALGVLRGVGIPVPLYPARLKNIRADYCFSMAKSVRAGHVQRYDLRDGIRRTLDWYEARHRL